MSPDNFSTNSEAFTAHLHRALSPALWLRRFRLRCASPDCEQRSRLWPGFLSKSRGVTLDGHWYCSGECLFDPLMAEVRGLLAGFGRERTRRYRLPLGLLLLDRGAISHQQLREALLSQLNSGGQKIGYVLRQMGAATAADVTAALAQQWGCPVFPLDPQAALQGCRDLLPLSLLESARAVPAYVSPDGRTLHLAFSERLDHTTLYAVERMLGCRTIACAADESLVAKVLDEIHRSSSIAESSFDTMRDPREIAWTIRSYAGEYAASRIAIVRASSYLWVRFTSGRVSKDLLFRIRSEPNPLAISPVSPNVFSTSADTHKDGLSDAAATL